MADLGPAPAGFRWVSKFLMSDSRSWNGKSSLTDVRSVDVHPSGKWAIVDMGDTTAWIRIPDDVTLVEFQHQWELKEVTDPLRSPKRRSKIYKAGAHEAAPDPGVFERLWQLLRRRT